MEKQKPLKKIVEMVTAKILKKTAVALRKWFRKPTFGFVFIYGA